MPSGVWDSVTALTTKVFPGSQTLSYPNTEQSSLSTAASGMAIKTAKTPPFRKPTPHFGLPKSHAINNETKILGGSWRLKDGTLPETVEAVVTTIRQNGEILRQTQEDRRKVREEYRQQRRRQKEHIAALKADFQAIYPKR